MKRVLTVLATQTHSVSNLMLDLLSLIIIRLELKCYSSFLSIHQTSTRLLLSMPPLKTIKQALTSLSHNLALTGQTITPPPPREQVESV
jgi:hypothetical protein